MAEVIALNYKTPAQFPPLMRNRNFILLFCGQVVAAMGDRIHFLVMLALLSRSVAAQRGLASYTAGTQETAQLTIMMLAPFLLWGPITGLIADRFSRRGIMITSDLARVAIVIIARTVFLEMPAFSTLFFLLASEFVIASFSALFSPARLALLPNLVHSDQLLRANSLTNATGTIASLIGFVLGGALVAWHLEYAMFIDAGTFLLSALSIMLMKIPPEAAVITKNKQESFVAEFTGGVRYIRNHKRIIQIIGLMLLFWTCGTIILNGLTGIITHHFGLSLEWYSYFMGIVGFGMVLGAASVSLAKHGIPKEIGIAWSMAAVGVCLFLFSLANTWWVGLIFLVGSAAAGAVLLVSLETLLQRSVPNYVRGRVMGAKDIITTFGLISVAIPLAIDPDIDNVIRLVLRILSIVVVGVGAWLAIYYYRHGTMRPAVAIARRVVVAYVTLWHRFVRVGPSRIPPKGPVIVVANHTSGLDPLALQASSPRRVIQFMIAKEYYEAFPLKYVFSAMSMIPVNRSGTDIASFRVALRELKDGHCLGIFPEGKISLDGKLQKAYPGVAALALLSGATVVPAYISGTRRHETVTKDLLRRARLSIRYGKPMRFDHYAEQGRDKDVQEKVTAEIMAAIAALGEATRGTGDGTTPVDPLCSQLPQG